MSSNQGQHGESIKLAIAANIYAARKARGMTQRALAAELDTDVMQVSRWERAEHRPNAHYETRLADVLFGGDLAALYRAEAA